MPYQAVIFDLFGTLVDDFSRRQYDAVCHQMADAVAAPYADFHQLLGQTYRDRCLGLYASIEDNITVVCHRLGLIPTPAQIAQAATYRYAFTAHTLIPEQAVLETLGALRRERLCLGLISDCGPDVPALWHGCPLAPLIDAALFSCREGHTKPHIELYQSIARKLEVAPRACVYVGDGSSQELTGAAAAGFLPVLRRIPLDDVYDQHRTEVDAWQGLWIRQIRELPQMLQGLAHPLGRP